MPILPPYDRILILTEGRLGLFSSKTAAALLRYRAEHVTGLIDSQAAGRKLSELIPWGGAKPIWPGVPEALRALAERGLPPPQALFIGVAPSGGALPPEMRRSVRAALAAGLDVVSGLHERLADDPEFVAAAVGGRAQLFDLRSSGAHRTSSDPARAAGGLVVASGRAIATRCRRILTVGSDCNVGKMVAALELTAAARKYGLDARFIATGQTGMMIAGRGVAVDAVVADFAAGAAEELVLADGDADLCIVEGQGSIAHPGFSGVTLALLHGVCPDVLVLVHHVGRRRFKSADAYEIPPLPRLVWLYEGLASLLHPARVAAVALNSAGLAEEQYAEARSRIEHELGLPAADLLREGAERLLPALLPQT